VIASNFECRNCNTLVGIQWLYRAVFFALIFVTTTLSTIAVLAQQGLYAALIWLPFPIGAIGYAHW
jgi:hypothetical protein